MSEEEEKKYNVVILNRDTVTTYPRMDEPAKTVLVTYVAAGLAPHTLHIPEEKYSEPKEKKLIRQSIEKRLEKKPETYKV